MNTLHELEMLFDKYNVENQKIECIKKIRSITRAGLKESKDFFEQILEPTILGKPHTHRVYEEEKRQNLGDILNDAMRSDEYGLLQEEDVIAVAKQLVLRVKALEDRMTYIDKLENEMKMLKERISGTQARKVAKSIFDGGPL